MKSRRGQASTGSAVGENRSTVADSIQPMVVRAPAEVRIFYIKSPFAHGLTAFTAIYSIAISISPK
jgi:hypothetical protein